MKGLSGVNQMLGNENRMLRNKIMQLEQSQQQGMFLETLTAHALGGILAGGEKDVTVAAGKAVEAASAVFDKVVAEGRAALQADEAKTQDDEPAAELVEEESLIIKP